MNSYFVTASRWLLCNAIIVVIFKEKSAILEVVDQETLMNQMISMNRQPTDPAIKANNKRVIRLQKTGILGKLAHILEVDPFVLILTKEGNKDVLHDVAMKLDVMSFITQTRTNVANGTNGSH